MLILSELQSIIWLACIVRSQPTYC